MARTVKVKGYKMPKMTVKTHTVKAHSVKGYTRAKPKRR